MAAPVLAADGKPQAMSRRCGTCILRPGGSSLVPPEVVRDLIDRHRRAGSVVVCHKTLPSIPGSHPYLGYTACRGFLDAYPETLGAVIVGPFFGGWHLIDPPEEDAADGDGG